MRFNVMSIPTLLVFDKGELAKKLVGAGQGPVAAGAQRISAYFPLTPGRRGEAIRDLQRRLGAGFAPAPGAEVGEICAGPKSRPRLPGGPRPARRRGVRRDHLDRAGRSQLELGDRLLFLTSPNLRGDDVAGCSTA